MMKKALLTAGLLSVMSAASASVIFTDDFTYSGALTANGYTAHSGAGAQPVSTTTGLTYAGYAGSGVGNAAALNVATGSAEDIAKLFSPVSSGPVYAAFLLNVPNWTVADGYFIHFGQDSGSGGLLNTSVFKGKIFSTTDGSGDYELGLTYQTNTITSKTAMDLAFNTTYLVVLKYDNVGSVGSDDTVSLYVFASGVPAVEPGTPTLGPIAASSESGTDFAAGLSGIAFRQAVNGQKETFDGLRIATTWSEAAAPSGGSAVNDWTVYE